jgi:hypothetical protein
MEAGKPFVNEECKMAKKGVGFKQKFKYSFDNFMSKGGMSVFLALMSLFIGAIVVIAVLRFVANVISPQEGLESLKDQWWLSFLQIADGGSIAEDTGSNAVNRTVGIIALFFGMVLFSSLVAFITSQFEQMLTEMRKGKSNVIEKDHTLILGFGDRALEIIRELIVANESEKDAAVVVLAEVEKDEMDDFFRDRIEDAKTTRIVTRSGSTSSLYLLRRASVETAKSVVILSDAAKDAAVDDKALADARVVKTILAVISCTGEENMPPITAELHLPSKQRLARNISERIAVIDEKSVLSKMMVQTSRISGLALVLDHVVGFEGNEFYFDKRAGGWGRKTYGDMIFHYPACSVIGVRTNDGGIRMNPDRNYVLEDTDEIIVLAEDDSTVAFSEARSPVNRLLPIRPAGPRAKQVEKQLIVGWSQKTPLIVDEYSQYLVDGSGIDVVLAGPTEEMKKEFLTIKQKYPSIKIRLLEASLDGPGVVNALRPEQYDNVIILSSDSGPAELRDADTIADLLEFRQYFKTLNVPNIKTQLITEVADSENVDIVKEAGVKDFLISNQFVSKIYAQVSEDQDVLKIYDDLFSEEGSEVYLKPVSLFMSEIPPSVSFADLCAAAIERNESCFGVRILREEEDASKHFGIYINPEKTAQFSLGAEDCLITLAEDES